MKNDYLAHYGVLGMRWGVRHDKKPSGLRDRAHNAHMGARRAYREYLIDDFEDRATMYSRSNKSALDRARRAKSKEKAYKLKQKASKYKTRAKKYTNMAEDIRSTRLSDKTFMDKAHAGSKLVIPYFGSTLGASKVFKAAAGGASILNPALYTSIMLGSMAVGEGTLEALHYTVTENAYDKYGKK